MDNNKLNTIDILNKASPAKAGKRFVSFILDSIIVLIVSYFLFLGGFEITKSTDSYKSDTEIVREEIAFYNDFVKESHIVEFVDEANEVRKDSVSMVLENLSRAIYHSYKVFGNSQNPDFVIDEDDAVIKFGESSLMTDSVSYFYTQYIPSHGEYNIVDFGEKDDITYLYDVYRDAFNENQTLFLFDRSQSEVPVLKSTPAYYLNYYLFVSQDDDIGKIGEQYYTVYYNSYSYMLDEAEELLLKSEPYYSDHYLVYQNSYYSQGRSVLYTLLICFVIANLICVLLPKLLFKNEQSLGRKIMSQGTIQNDSKPIKTWKVVVRNIIEMPSFTWIFILTLLFPPFNGVYDVLYIPIWKGAGMPFFLVMFILLAIYCIINVPMLFNHYRQSLSDLAFGLKVKDEKHIDEGDNDDQFEGKSY